MLLVLPLSDKKIEIIKIVMAEFYFFRMADGFEDLLIPVFDGVKFFHYLTFEVDELFLLVFEWPFSILISFFCFMTEDFISESLLL